MGVEAFSEPSDVGGGGEAYTCVRGGNPEVGGRRRFCPFVEASTLLPRWENRRGSVFGTL